MNVASAVSFVWDTKPDFPSFATPSSSTTAPRVPAVATTLPTEPVSIDEGTHTGEVNEATLVPAKTLTPREVATPPTIVQTEAASPVTLPIISINDPFVVLSQAVKDGSSLVVTPSSIPSSTTHGPDVDLSFKGSKDILEDPDDEPVSKKRISDSDEEENVLPEAEFMGVCLSSFPFFFFFFFFWFLPSSFFSFLSSSSLYVCTCISPFVAISLYLCAYFPASTKTFEGPGVAVNIDMPLTVSPATPIAPVSAIPSTPISAVPAAPIPTGPSEFLISSLISFSQVCCS